MTREQLTAWCTDNDVDTRTLGTPSDWDEDTSFGRCDITGEQGDLEPMCYLDTSGECCIVEVLADVAYILHGIGGAY